MLNFISLGCLIAAAFVETVDSRTISSALRHHHPNFLPIFHFGPGLQALLNEQEERKDVVLPNGQVIGAAKGPSNRPLPFLRKGKRSIIHNVKCEQEKWLVFNNDTLDCGRFEFRTLLGTSLV